MRRALGAALALGALILLTSWPAFAAPANVTITDTAYEPAEATILLGELVTWTDSSGAHSVTFDDGTDSVPEGTACQVIVGGNGCLHPGDSFTLTFNTAGRFHYTCRVHPEMEGTVVVASGQTTTSSTTTTTTSTTTTTTTTSTTVPDQSTASQSAPPTITPNNGSALPKSTVRDQKIDDDLRPWVIVDVAIAGTTVITGVVLVRKGRVPFG